MKIGVPLLAQGMYTEMMTQIVLVSSRVATMRAQLLVLVQNVVAQVARLSAIAGGQVELLVSCMRCHLSNFVSGRPRGTLPLLRVLVAVHVLVGLAQCSSTDLPFFRCSFVPRRMQSPTRLPSPPSSMSSVVFSFAAYP